MKQRVIAAILLAGAVAAGGAAIAHERGAGRGGSDGHGPGGAFGGAMLDFDAVAGEGTDSLDRGTLVDWGVDRLGALDTDNNGSLDREELAAAMPEMPRSELMVFAPDPTEARVDRMLRMFDAEETGEVSVEAVVNRQVDGLFRRLDRDDDGSISREEAEAGPGRRDRRSRD